MSANQQMVSPGGNFMLLNGLAFDIKQFELYPLLDRLRIEARLAGRVSQALSLPAEAVHRVLAVRGEAASELRLFKGSGFEQCRQGRRWDKRVVQCAARGCSRAPTGVSGPLRSGPAQLTSRALSG